MITEEPLIQYLEAEVLQPVGGFILGISHLGVDDLGDPDTDLAWVPYLCKARSVTSSRGGTRNGVTNSISVGDLNVTLVDAPPLETNPYLKPDAKFRLVYRPTSEPIYTGKILDVDQAEERDGSTNKIHNFTTLVCVDAVKDHANVTRYGALGPAGGETFPERVERLAGSATAPVELPPATAGPYLLAPTLLDAPLVEHFDLVTDSVGAYWWVDRFGVTQFRLALDPAAPVAAFSDVRAPGNLEYSGIQKVYDTRSVVNDLALTNQGIEIDPETFEASAIDTTTTYVDLTARATWGPRLGSIDTNLVDGDVAARAAEILSVSKDPVIQFVGLVWNGQDHLATAAQLDVYSPVIVSRSGVDQNSRIIGIKHTITPTRWILDLALIKEG